MDFVELEAIEGLRWCWNSWPASKAESTDLVIPLSIMCTPLMQQAELPVLPYDPVTCRQCGAVLNPYARVEYTSRIWFCSFCLHKNSFPHSYSNIGETNLPAELFPTYSAVEYAKTANPVANSGPNHNWANGLSSSSLSLSSMVSTAPSSLPDGDPRGLRPAFVFVVDACTSGEELGALKNELLLVVEQLPETALVGLVTFDSMVQVHDLGFSECSRAVVFHGARELSSHQTQQFLGIKRPTYQQLGKMSVNQKQGFLVPVSDCEFNITTAIEEIHSSLLGKPGNRPLRSTGVAISAAVGLLEGCSVSTGSRIMVFTSGPATLGPGIIVDSNLGNSIRTHRDLINGHTPYYGRSCSFYRQVSQRLTDASIVLDLFACSLDQAGVAELKAPVESSGGFMMLGESLAKHQTVELRTQMGGGGGRGRGGSRTQRRHFRQNRENVWKRPKSDPSSENNPENNGENRGWQPFATQNPAFDEYYKEQGIVTPEEWDGFIEVLRKPLPAAFRINSSSQFCSDIRTQLEDDFMISLQAEVSEGGELVPIRPLPWYPENLAWHSNFSRMQLRKNQTLERFHEFLKLENEIGNITRQEAVSMVPPLFLDVRPDHFVLDMCAAPGSKTFQLLEIIHRSTKPGSLPDGLVVANDLDVQRCNLLIHQTKRMCTANLIVTNHEAQHFPGCRLKKSCSTASEIGAEKEPPISQLVFDRVLCDVPCSGDGTLRKAPDIWRKWHVGLGNGVHPLQVQIAMRGLSLLKVGGRMVYSTCSMNPVENEAVIAEILRKCDGSVELVDVSSELPQLVRRPGLKKWKVRDKGRWLVSHKNVSKYRKSVIVPSMFPSGRRFTEPTDHNGSMEVEEKHENGENGNVEDALESSDDPATLANEQDEEVSDFPLERCMRIVPHDQNGGAFFIAVFHKRSDLPANQGKPNSLEGDLGPRNDDPQVQLQNQSTEDTSGIVASSADGTDEAFSEAASEAELIKDELDGDSLELDPSVTCEENVNVLEEAQAPSDKEIDPKKTGGKRKLQTQGKWRGVDPVVFFKDEATINSIKKFYGIDDSFPFNGHLVTRNSDANHVKRIYYVSKSVKDVLELNFSVGQQLKITSIGLKMFERQTAREGNLAPCSFRISSEGLPLILPYITKQIVYASPVDFKHLLQYKSIKFADFVDAELGQKASGLMSGCCVIVLRKDGKALSDSIEVDDSTIAIGCWKGKSSLSVMVTAIDCQELLERLLMRMETEKGSLEKKDEVSNAKGDEEQDIKDMEKNGDEESITPETEG